jgi:diacylglycerol kinase (ATP)
MATVHVFANPSAGAARTDGVGSTVVDRIRSRGHDVELVAGDGTMAGARSALEAVVGSATRVVVVGGDGTVHTAIGVLANTGVTMGVVPVGTGNDTATALGLLDHGRFDLDRAVDRALADGVPIDLIDTGHDTVISVATAGFSVDVNKLANRMRFPSGANRYRVATMRLIPRLRPLQIRLTIDGTVHDIETVLLAVGNTGWFGGGMQICPNADPTDGLLDVTIVGAVGRVELLRVFPTVYKGTHLSHRAVSTFRGREIRVEGVADIWGDGEPVTEMPCTLTARPGAMLVAGARPVDVGRGQR